MKTIFYLLLLSLFTITTFSQTYNVKIYSGGETVISQTSHIDSITFEISTNSICGSKVLWHGELYQTVLIETQCWFAKNLNVGTRINGSQSQTDNSTIEKYCYDDLESNCDMYGGLYQWAEAVQYLNGATNSGSPNPAFSGNVQGICPPGWHIPTLAEFQTLSSTVGNNSNALKTVGQGTGDGAGTNSSGFSALLAGYRFEDGDFYYLGSRTYFWGSTEYSSSDAYVMLLSYSSSIVNLYDYNKEDGFSVRCVQD